jgi:hypothetical protein
MPSKPPKKPAEAPASRHKAMARSMVPYSAGLARPAQSRAGFCVAADCSALRRAIESLQGGLQWADMGRSTVEWRGSANTGSWRGHGAHRGDIKNRIVSCPLPSATLRSLSHAAM